METQMVKHSEIDLDLGWHSETAMGTQTDLAKATRMDWLMDWLKG